jgi:septal ring factor EnvC (AmiA/AmiB activator)
MFMETPQTLIILTGGAFLLGWLVGKIGAYFGNRIAAKSRDPRDDRIRSLDAELRIARSDGKKSKSELEEKSKEFKQAETENEELTEKLEKECAATVSLRLDLKESVKKTRELRAELSDRATENIKSEVKLREVETELSVAQASTDLIATGVLDYSVAPGEEDEEDNVQIVKSSF